MMGNDADTEHWRSLGPGAAGLWAGGRGLAEEGVGCRSPGALAALGLGVLGVEGGGGGAVIAEFREGPSERRGRRRQLLLAEGLARAEYEEGTSDPALPLRGRGTRNPWRALGGLKGSRRRR